jgi:hypothetical protein
MRFSHISDCRDDEGVVGSFQDRGRMFSLYTPSFEIVGSLRWNNVRFAGVVSALCIAFHVHLVGFSMSDRWNAHV